MLLSHSLSLSLRFVHNACFYLTHCLSPYVSLTFCQATLRCSTLFHHANDAPSLIQAAQNCLPPPPESKIELWNLICPGATQPNPRSASGRLRMSKGHTELDFRLSVRQPKVLSMFLRRLALVCLTFAMFASANLPDDTAALRRQLKETSFGLWPSCSISRTTSEQWMIHCRSWEVHDRAWMTGLPWQPHLHNHGDTKALTSQG